jgi:hypothetical protein
MQFTSALGICQKCGQSKIQVEGNVKCLLCDSEPGNSGLVVKVEDPGHDAMDKLLSKAGVLNVGGGKPPAPIKPHLEAKAEVTKQYIPTPAVSTTGVFDALAILRALPMPKDIKQFKQINKAIKILEDLGA